MTSLRESAIRRALAGDCLVGREVRVLPEVGSTNDYLKEAAREGAPEGLAVLAERQTAGKGRLGRSCQSPERASGGAGRARGLGSGLNGSQRREDFPPELRETAGSLAMLTGREVPREALAGAILRWLDGMYRDLLADDLDAWRGAYRAAGVNLGREVRILRPDGRETLATALDVDRDFGLIVRRTDGTEEILRSGEDSVRRLTGYAEGRKTERIPPAQNRRRAPLPQK